MGDALWEGEEDADDDVLWVGEGDADVDVLADGDGEDDALAVGEEDAVGDAEADADADAEADADPDAGGDAAGDLAGAGVCDGVTVAGEEGLRNSDSEGLRAAFAPGTAGDTDDDERGATDAGAVAGAVAAGVVSAAPARDWLGGADEWGTAPVRTKTAAADAATSPPVIPADATGRERRCRPARPLLPGPGWPAAGTPNGMTFPPEAALRSSAADCPAAEP